MIITTTIIIIIIIMKLDKEVRHLTDIESNIKHCLDDLLENNYLSKEDYN